MLGSLVGFKIECSVVSEAPLFLLVDLRLGLAFRLGSLKIRIESIGIWVSKPVSSLKLNRVRLMISVSIGREEGAESMTSSWQNFSSCAIMGIYIWVYMGNYRRCYGARITFKDCICRLADEMRLRSVHLLVLNSAICTSNFCVARYILLSSRLINVDASRKWISLKY